MNRNRTKGLLWATAAAAISLNAANSLSAAESSVRVGDTELKGAVHTDSYRANTTATDKEMPVSKVNKASSLIGMDVRNSQNEKLGEIKDLVLDLQSGKISYAVLSVGGFLGIGDKYVAVPTSAFSVAADQDKLVLNADKAKIQNAPSFAKTSWPEVNSPSWDKESAYWLSDSTALGTAGSIRSGTATDHLDTTANDRTGHNSALDRSTSTDRNLRHSGTLSDRDAFRGRITAINPESKTMTVEGPSGKRDFKFSDRPVITLKDSRNPSLIDLKVGFPVVVGFHNDNGTYVADSVIRSDTPEVR